MTWSREDQRAAARRYHARNRERIHAKAWARIKGDPEQRRRKTIRQRVKKAIDVGRLVREPCLFCDDPDTHAHHHDYDEPLAVTFLCARHHKLVHKEA